MNQNKALKQVNPTQLYKSKLKSKESLNQKAINTQNNPFFIILDQLCKTWFAKLMLQDILQQRQISYIFLMDPRVNMQPQLETFYYGERQHALNNDPTGTQTFNGTFIQDDFGNHRNNAVQLCQYQFQSPLKSIDSHYYPHQFANCNQFKLQYPLSLQYINQYPTVNMHKQQQFQVTEQFPKTIPSPPSLEFSDYYIHYKYLIELKNTHKFENFTFPPPHQLISYLLRFLSLQNCQYELSALSYIAVNIPYFHIHFTQQQLNFLHFLINSKYPWPINYRKQYKKIQIMDQSQCSKLLDLMQTLCLIVGKIEEQQFCEQHHQQHMWKYSQKNSEISNNASYMHWVTNCLHVAVTHLNSKEFEQHSSETSTQMPNQIQQLNSIINNSVLQLVNLIKFYNYVLEPNQFDKVMDILYELIPNQKIMEFNKMQNVFSLIQTSKICNIHLMNHSNLGQMQFPSLFDLLYSKLLIQLNRISRKLLTIENMVHQDLQIKAFYNNFCFKVINILSLCQWSKDQEIELIRLIHSCSFICGMQLESNRQEVLNDCKKMIDFAISISINAKSESTYGIEELHAVDKNVKNDDFW